MKVSLLFPPQACLVSPCLGLPSLTAYLRSHGHAVSQRDLNVEAYETLLTAEHLARATDVLDGKLARLRAGEGSEQARGAVSGSARWERLVRARVAAPYASQHIEEAKFVMRDAEAFYDFERFTWAANVVEYGLAIINAEFETLVFPMQGGFEETFASWSVAELLALSDDAEHNAFLAYLRDVAAPAVLAESPDLVGISITYHTQILHGLILARLLRTARPDLPIYLGGAILSELAEVLMRPAPGGRSLFGLVNGFVVGEGERALLALLEAHGQGAGLDDVPNLVYWTPDGEVRANRLGVMENVSLFPTPDYTGLPLDKYLAPRRLGYLTASRGCYWNRCAFCTSPNALGRNGYRLRPIEKVVEDMRVLRERHGMDLFFFCDDCFAPARMESLASAIKAQGLPVQWVAETRLDRRLSAARCRTLAEGGCTHLVFGLESAVQRVLDLMDKGTDMAAVRQVLDNCHRAGIGAVLMTFVNFPTETRAEMQATVDFLREVKPQIGFATLGRFTLMRGSPVDLAPDAYGIGRVHRPAPDKLAYIYDYELADGTTPLDLEARFLEAARQLDELYQAERRLFHSIHFFLHATHRGAINLQAEDRRAHGRTEASLLDQALTRPAGLVQHTVRANGYTLRLAFDQSNGRMTPLEAHESELLAACDGRARVRELLDRGGPAPAVNRPRLRTWFEDLKAFRSLIAKGVLIEGVSDAMQDHPAVPAGR